MRFVRVSTTLVYTTMVLAKMQSLHAGPVPTPRRYR